MKVKKLRKILSCNMIYNIYSNGCFIDQCKTFDSVLLGYGEREIDRIYGLVIREPEIKPAICIELKS